MSGVQEFFWEGRLLHLDKKLKEIEKNDLYDAIQKLPVRGENGDFVSRYLSKTFLYVRQHEDLMPYVLAWFFPHEYSSSFSSLMDFLFHLLYPSWDTTDDLLDLGSYIDTLNLESNLFFKEFSYRAIYQFIDELTLFYVQSMIRVFVRSPHTTSLNLVQLQAPAYAYKTWGYFIRKYSIPNEHRWDLFIEFMNILNLWPIVNTE